MVWADKNKSGCSEDL